MKILITDILKKRLSLMLKIATANKKESPYPIAIKVDTKGILHAANLRMSCSFKLTTEELGLVPEYFEEPQLLPEKAIRLLLDTTIGTTVVIDVEDKVLTIKEEKKRNKAKIATMSSEQFPAIAAFKPAVFQRISSESFLSAIKSTIFAVSFDSKRPVYNCLNFIFKDNVVTAFACDGVKASIYKIPCEKCEDATISIPRDVLSVIQGINLDDEIQLGISQDYRTACFAVDTQTVVRCTLVVGEVMDYNTIFTEKRYQITVSKAKLVSVLKKILLVYEAAKDSTPRVKCTVDDNIELSYKGVISEYSDFIEYKGKKNECYFGINGAYFLEALDALGSDEVTLAYDSPLVPVTIKDDTVTTLVVPMRLQSQ